jgi:hypothetical protein
VYQRVTVRLDRLQLAWCDALGELHGWSRTAVIREGILYLAAKESARLQRTRRVELLGQIAREQQLDPVANYWRARDERERAVRDVGPQRPCFLDPSVDPSWRVAP